MTDLTQPGRSRPSLSAPTPRGVSAGKIGKCVPALRPRFRSALSFTSPLSFTRDASAHEPAAVRRHHAPGATGLFGLPVADCAFALVASAGVRFAVGIIACAVNVPQYTYANQE